MHRDTAIEGAPENEPQDAEEIRERIIAKLKRLKQRFDAETE